MKLSIALIAASVILRWTTPGPGTFYVFTADNVHRGNVRIVVAGYEDRACNWALKVKPGPGERVGVYWTAFFPASAAAAQP